MPDYKVTVTMTTEHAALAENEAHLLRVDLDEYLSRIIHAAYSSGAKRWEGKAPAPSLEQAK